MWLKNLFCFERINLESLIKKKLDEGKLSEHKLPFINKLNTSADFKFYKTDEKNKQFWIEEIDKLDKDSMCVYTGYKIITIFKDNSIITIVFDWIGLKELIKIFEDNPMFSDESSKRKLFIVRYDLSNYLNNLNKNYESIIAEFKDIVIQNDTIILYRKIIPTTAVVNKYNKVKIPEDCAIPIERVVIYSNPSGLISSVKIIGKHPNADKDGWFCLGELKMIPLSVNAIYNIIAQIKCYKLDDCYWRPNNYKDWK